MSPVWLGGGREERRGLAAAPKGGLAAVLANCQRPRERPLAVKSDEGATEIQERYEIDDSFLSSV